jgi:hypothetical protein
MREYEISETVFEQVTHLCIQAIKQEGEVAGTGLNQEVEKMFVDSI